MKMNLVQYKCLEEEERDAHDEKLATSSRILQLPFCTKYSIMFTLQIFFRFYIYFLESHCYFHAIRTVEV